MDLTASQQRMLAGRHGEVPQRMLRLLVHLGRLYGASRMIPVSSVQVSGVSYKSIADPGLHFLEDLSARGARVVVPAYSNPAGMDVTAWRELGFPEAFAVRQLRILRALEALGVNLSLTCTPYLAGLVPGRGDHIAWSESSAVCFANSVLGARTNREGGPSALAAAICGVTPEYGLHTERGRYPETVVEVQCELGDATDFGTLGYAVGRASKGHVLYFRGISHAGQDELKMLGAALAASGAVSLFHVEGVTPEAALVPVPRTAAMTITQRALQDTKALLNARAGRVEAVILGCPHASLEEVERAVLCVRGRRLRRLLWISTSRAVRSLAEARGLVREIEAAGGRVLADTCAVVAPIEEMGFRAVGVNSAKCAHYLPGFCRQQVVYEGMESLIEDSLQ